MKTPKYIPKWFRDLCEERAYALKKITGILPCGQTGRTDNAFVRMCWEFYWEGWNKIAEFEVRYTILDKKT